MEPEKPMSSSGPRLDSPVPQHSSGLHAGGSRSSGPYTQPPRPAKPKRKWLPALALAAALGAGAVGVHYYTGNHNTSPPPVVTQSQQTLTLSGADLDLATTNQAITAIRAGQNDNPLIAKLTEQQKQEILSGQRKFYKLPVVPPPSAQSGPFAPATPPQIEAKAPARLHAAAPIEPAVHPSAPAPQQQPAPLQPQDQQPAPVQPQAAQPQPVLPAPAQAQPQDSAPLGRVQIVLDGAVSGTYTITSSPFTLDAPLKMGDVWGVTCLELAPGKNSVTIGIANVLNPVQTTLSVGQSTTWTVGPPVTPAPDYAWFHTQADNGNPVAEYGLGHMYEYGIGEPKDINQAIHWYQLAANQHYLDAQQRLTELGQ